MSSGNASDDEGSLNDFANLRDIVSPKVKDQNIPAEYLISDNLLVPGVLTQYLDEQVLFKPYLSDAIFNVPYNQIRHPPGPGIPIGCKYEVGNKVEAYLLDAKLNLHGWARSTIRSFVKDTYVVILEQSKSLVIVQRDEIRAITTGAYLNNRYLYTFNIPVPHQELQNFSSNIQVHDSFCKAIGNPHMSYDIERNALVVRSNNADCESIAKILLSIYFANLTQRMLLIKSTNELVVKLKTMKNGLLEQFQVQPDLLNVVIGKNGKNIRKAETIDGITYIKVLKETNTVKIYAQNQDALKKASEYLKLDKEVIEISNEMLSKVIGKNGQIVQEIADRSKLRHIVIITNENPASEVTELEFVGTSSSIAQAKFLFKFHLDHLWEFNKLFLAGSVVNPQRNTAFGNKKTKLLSESPAESIPSYKVTRRVFTGLNHQKNKKFFTNANQGLIFYSENQSRGGQRISSGERFNAASRSRGRFGYNNMESLVDDSEARNSTDQTVKQFQQSTTYRGRSRGRGRGRRLAYGVNYSSSRKSQNGSSPDENDEQEQTEPLIESGDASTSQDKRELEKQRKQGAIKRVPQNSQQRNNTDTTSSTSNDTAEIQAEPKNQKFWHTKVWRNTTALCLDMQTWEYENLNKVYYGKSNTKNPTDTTRDSAATEEI